MTQGGGEGNMKPRHHIFPLKRSPEENDRNLAAPKFEFFLWLPDFEDRLELDKLQLQLGFPQCHSNLGRRGLNSIYTYRFFSFLLTFWKHKIRSWGRYSFSCWAEGVDLKTKAFSFGVKGENKKSPPIRVAMAVKIFPLSLGARFSDFWSNSHFVQASC